MPSPFPGMDPYLEAPAFFPGLHDSLIYNIKAALQPILPAAYYADSAERVWIEPSHRTIEPDVNIIRRRPEREESPAEDQPGGGLAVATLVETAVETLVAEPVTVTVPETEFHESYIEIMTRFGEEERVTTVIEVLSPSNKRPGPGRMLYLQKQQEVLAAGQHLVEIDLLRAGDHATAVPIECALDRVGRYDYHVCIKRADRQWEYQVYPIRLPQRLPTIFVPLLPGDGEVPLDLQAVFARSYETGPYHKRVRYGQDTPDPPLPAEQAAWATKLVGVTS